MSHRTAARIGWGIFVLSIALYGVVVALLVLNAGTSVRTTYGTRYSPVFTVLAYLAFPAVGALIASRRPTNPIGWLMLAMGPIFGLQSATWELAVYGLLTEPGFPGGAVASWIAGWVWVPGFAIIATLLLLLFPEGTLPSKRWRPFAWATATVIALGTIGFAFSPGILEEAPIPIQNPYGLSGFFEILQLLFFLSPILFLVSAGSLVVRYRRAGAELRQQLKWLAYAATVVALGFLVVFALSLPRITSNFDRDLPTWLGVLQDAVTLSVAGIPIAVGIAVLKYRLYEINVIINRTLVYVPLVAIIGGLATALIPLSQRVFMSLTGNTSDAAIVLTTLFVASLVTPVRKRLEAAVEGRFKRATAEAKNLPEGDGPGALPERLVGELRSLADRMDALADRIDTVEQRQRRD